VNVRKHKQRKESKTERKEVKYLTTNKAAKIKEEEMS
jgi:hypothetical protein